MADKFVTETIPHWVWDSETRAHYAAHYCRWSPEPWNVPESRGIWGQYGRLQRREFLVLQVLRWEIGQGQVSEYSSSTERLGPVKPERYGYDIDAAGNKYKSDFGCKLSDGKMQITK